MRYMKAANVIALSFLLLLVGSVPAFAAPSSPCQTADRNVLDAIQRYQSAVRSVPTQCNKGATTCTTALTTAYDSLVALDDAHITMVNTCTVTDPDPPPPPPPPTNRSGLILNEVDYDQVSTDDAEFVEIFNSNADTVSLDGIAVVFVNGANNTEYLRVNLSGSLSAGGYAVIVPPTSTVTPQEGSLVFKFVTSSTIIQNGPDGIAIIDTNAGTVLDALSYGGSITGALIAGISGTVNLVEGTLTTAVDVGTGPGSLARIPNGTDTDDANTDWKFTTTPTPGGANN